MEMGGWHRGGGGIRSVLKVELICFRVFVVCVRLILKLVLFNDRANFFSIYIYIYIYNFFFACFLFTLDLHLFYGFLKVVLYNCFISN